MPPPLVPASSLLSAEPTRMLPPDVSSTIAPASSIDGDAAAARLGARLG